MSPAPTRPTATAPARTQPAQPTARPAGTVAITGAGTSPAGRRTVMPGPRLFSWMRFLLVVVTVGATVLSAFAIAGAYLARDQNATAARHSQSLAELRAQVGSAQASALSSLLDPAGDGRSEWTGFERSHDRTMSLLLDASATADPASEMAAWSPDLLRWASALTSAHQQALAGGDPASSVIEATVIFTRLDQALATAATPAPSGDATGVVVAAMVLGVLAGAGFLLALVVTARRTHRVINLGLLAGLLGCVAIVVTVGLVNADLSRDARAGADVVALSGLQADVWRVRSLDAEAVLTTGSLTEATELAASVQRRVESAWPAFSGPAAALVAHQSQLAARPEAALVLDHGVWQEFSDQVGAVIDQEHAQGLGGASTGAWPILWAGLFGLVAVVATLAGVHQRTKEYA